MTKMTDTEFEALFNRAMEAGFAAGASGEVKPMGVTDGKTVWIVSDGACGFAGVHVAGNIPFGRWLKKTKRAGQGYPTGLSIWISDHNQSMARKELHANKMAEMFRAAGIECYASSRMD